MGKFTGVPPWLVADWWFGGVVPTPTESVSDANDVEPVAAGVVWGAGLLPSEPFCLPSIFCAAPAGPAAGLVAHAVVEAWLGAVQAAICAVGSVGGVFDVNGTELLNAG